MSRTSVRNANRTAKPPQGRMPKQNPKVPNSVSFRDLSRIAEAGISSEVTGILMRANAEIRMTITGTGFSIGMFDSRSGAAIGTSDDLVRISRLRQFVSKERAAAEADDTDDQLMAILETLVTLAREKEPNFEVRALPIDFIHKVKAYAKKFSNLADNLETIFQIEVEDTTAEVASKNFLLQMGEVIQNKLLDELVDDLIRDGRGKKGESERLLFDAGVPRDVYNKMTEVMVISKDSDINRILYPTNSGSWLKLSVKELRDMPRSPIMNEILALNSVQDAILKTDKVLKKITGLSPEINLGDESIPEVAALLRTKVSIIPHCINAEFAFSPMEKRKDQKLSLSMSTEKPSQVITSINEAIRRLLIGASNFSSSIDEYWMVLFPSIPLKGARLTASNNIHSIALKNLTDKVKSDYLDKLVRLSKDTDVDYYIKSICSMVRAGPKSSIHQGIAENRAEIFALSTFAHASVDSLRKASKNSRSSFVSMNVRLSSLDSAERRARAESYLQSLIPNRSKKKTTLNRVVNTPLSSKAERFIKKEIKSLPKSGPLAIAIETYLTGFMHKTVQNAVVEYLSTQLTSLDRVTKSNATRKKSWADTDSEEESGDDSSADESDED